MTTLRVVVCDDDPEAISGWVESIRSAASAAGSDVTVEGLTGAALTSAFEGLEKRLVAAREDGDSSSESVLDGFDIVVVDYDLVGLRPVETGEALAYLCRCYSTCSYVVGLNAFLGDFDLTMRGHLESFADLNMRAGSLGQVGLWNGQSTEGEFTPWTWPVLKDEPARFRGLVDRVARNLDANVLDELGFDEEYDLSRLTERQLEFLSPDDPRSATFRTVACNSGNGFRQLDLPLNNEAVARVAVSRIVKWLETSIAPGQEVVIDAPHLVTAYPSLVRGLQPAELNRNIGRTVAPDWADRISEAAAPTEWHSRPRWMMRKVSLLATLEENSDPWSDTSRDDLVFCEDTSRFEDSGSAFRADLTGVRTRYIKSVPGVDYRPLSRLVS